MEQSKFDRVRHLIDEIPAELLMGGSKTYGCPDCADQGGIYISIGNSPATITYYIDPTNTTDQSPATIAYKQKIMAAIEQLN